MDRLEPLFRAARRGAELVAAALFAAMFGAFLLQVFMRYVVGRPLEWSLEACLIAYVWVVFWSCAFLLRERDHVAFTMLYAGAPEGVRRWLAVLSAVAIGGAFLAAAPATVDFVAFMGIDRTWVLEIPFDLVFSVYLAFVAAVIGRSGLSLRRLLSRRWRGAI